MYDEFGKMDLDGINARAEELVKGCVYSLSLHKAERDCYGTV